MAEPWILLAGLARQFPLVNRFVIEVPNGEELLSKVFNLKGYKQVHYSTEHLYYFTNCTLAKVAEKAGLKVILNSQSQRYTLGNTLGWLADDTGGGQSRLSYFNGAVFHNAYQTALADAGLADSLLLIATPTENKSRSRVGRI